MTGGNDLDIAVVGSGIAGLGAAWALSRNHRVTVYEEALRLGGHARTVHVDDGDRSVPVDTGFIVYNERNYPNLVQLFEFLGVATEPSEMSFSVSMGGGRFEYRARALGLLGQPSNLADRGYRRMITDIVRFSREASRLGTVRPETTCEFLDREGYSQSFRRDFLLPMVACIWSSNLETMLEYPAPSLIRFLDNHGLLNVLERPAWRTVTGGSREYVARLSASVADRVRLGTAVSSIERSDDHVVVADTLGGLETFDQVVLATHADTSLRILGPDASAGERDILSAFRYQENRAVVHRDPAMMPMRRRLWSSWNYLAEDRAAAARDRVSVSYWMNRLQNLNTRLPVLVTLNPVREPRGTWSEQTFRHPQFDASAVAAQDGIPSLQGRRRTWYCGSYLGYGFHEDALRAGLEVAAALGSPPPWWPTSSDAREDRAREVAGAG